MTVLAPMASRPTGRWTGLLLLSTAFHVALLGGLALRLPLGSAPPAPADVSLVPAPILVRLSTSPPAAPKPPARVPLFVLDTALRYAAPVEAPTGQASDVVDLFGPVFADGQWPRPVVVRSEPCDPAEPPERREACRRELVLIGLATEPRAGSNAEP